MSIEFDFQHPLTKRILAQRGVFEEDVREVIQSPNEHGYVSDEADGVMYAFACLRRDCALRVEYGLVEGKYRIFNVVEL